MYKVARTLVPPLLRAAPLRPRLHVPQRIEQPSFVTTPTQRYEQSYQTALRWLVYGSLGLSAFGATQVAHSDSADRSYGIQCPFPVQQHLLEDSMPVNEKSFVEKHGFFKPGSTLEKQFFKAQFWKLTSGAYANAPKAAHLDIASDFVDWLFAHDDFRERAAKDMTPKEIREFNNALLDIMLNKRNPLDPTQLVNPENTQKVALQKALYDLHQRMSKVGDHGFVVSGLKDYFLSNIWEAENRQNARVPSIREYIDNRRGTSAVGPCIALGYLLADGKNPELTISKELFLKNMFYAAIDVVGLVNDVYSFYKELQEGIVENHVTVSFLDKLSVKIPGLKALFQEDRPEKVALRREVLKFIFELLLNQKPSSESPSALPPELKSEFDKLAKKIKDCNLKSIRQSAFQDTVKEINHITQHYLHNKKLCPPELQIKIFFECCENWMSANFCWSQLTYRYDPSLIKKS